MDFGSKDIKWVLLKLSVMLFCFYLAFSLFELLNKSSSIPTSLPLLNQKNTVELHELMEEAEGLRQQYSFMVFKKERSKIEFKLIRNIQKQINIRPFDANLWRELTFLQANDFSYNKKSTAIDRQWTFLVSKRFLQWNPHERVALLKRCVLFASDPQVNVKTACSELFSHALKTESISSLARQLDLKKTSLHNVISHFGLDVSQVVK